MPITDKNKNTVNKKATLRGGFCTLISIFSPGVGSCTKLPFKASYKIGRVGKATAFGNIPKLFTLFKHYNRPLHTATKQIFVKGGACVFFKALHKGGATYVKPFGKLGGNYFFGEMRAYI